MKKWKNTFCKKNFHEQNLEAFLENLRFLIGEQSTFLQ